MTNYAERAIFALRSLQFAGIILEARAFMTEKRACPRQQRINKFVERKIEFLRNYQVFNEVNNYI